MIFQQKPPKIKEGIINYLKNIIGLTNKREIVADLAHLSTSKTPKQSLGRTLNELYEKGILQKYYLENNTFKTWPTQKADRKLLRGTRLPTFFKFITDSIRKIVSTSIYCGSNELGNADNNPNFKKPRSPQPYRQADESPRKTPSDIKAWTFDTIENRDVNRKVELSRFLLDRLQEKNYPDTQKCFVHFLNDIIGDGINTGVKNADFQTFMDYLGYDTEQSMTGKTESQLYPKKYWSIRGVEQ